MQESNNPTIAAKEKANLHIAKYSRSKALFYLQNNNPGRAFAHLTVALNLVSEWRSDLESYFLEALRGGCKKLEEEGNLQTAIDVREQALLIYPENEAIICDTATLYFQLGNLVKATELYQLSLDTNPKFLPAFRALQTLKSLQLERWHFRMLNDVGRNRCYEEAIACKIHEGHLLVLDIGTGSGLLSLFAAQEGASHIFACEVQDSIFNIAVDVVKANECNDKITLIKKMSTDLKIPSDIPQKVSLVITEIFDAAVFGEGILQALIHAWDQLLLPPAPGLTSDAIECSEVFENNKSYGAVVPQSATVWIAAVQCADIARRHRVFPSHCFCPQKQQSTADKMISFGDELFLCRFCEAPIVPQTNPERLIECLFNSAYVGSLLTEPYDVENLEVIPHGYTFLTKPYNLLNVNFNCVDDLNKLIMAEVMEHTIMADDSGSVDAVIAWFHLHLDSTHTISTAPFQEDGLSRGWCWHQAIFPRLKTSPVFPGDAIFLKHTTNNGVLKIDPNCMKIKTVENDCEYDSVSDCLKQKPEFLVSGTIVTFLNNRTWIKALQDTAAHLSKTLCMVSQSSYQILDLNPFPFLGLKLLKLCETFSSPWKLFTFVETSADIQYIFHVAGSLGISMNQLEISSKEKWKMKIQENKFDIINLTLIDSTGEMCEEIVDFIPDLKQSLNRNGIMVPYSITIEGQIIESDWLQKNSKVTSDENVGNFKVSQYINKFVADHHLDINAKGIPFKPLSDPVEVMKLCINLEGDGGICSAVNTEVAIVPKTQGISAGFLHWFKFNFLPEMSPVSSYSTDSHCGQVVDLSCIPIADNCEILLNCTYYHGLLHLQLKKSE